ncbi:DUF1007 family protein [Phaeobacter sp. 22II1-1F12B]|uniref:DUF1007 family protein n=1 Tax=Phaeobacter sp. 22II1-1F12B TaxID=1317111 RepID=UPI000B527F8E|nr:DUF1007 family protein [Phaeobacter sp. 22II1-1F12B]OWU79371.1 polyphosphate kinase [Phaeobacter sp. 22II1-1F12B]
MFRSLLALFLTVPAHLAAHPHIFVDTGFEVILDETGRLTHIRTTWAYDDYYSLLITSDMGLDQDYDGVLTDEELEQLTGFDMNWIEGFNGDLVAALNGETLALSGPSEATAEFKAGRIITTHLREVEGHPQAVGGKLSLKPYDATYYTAYDVKLPVTVTGWNACMIENIMPQIGDDLADLQQQLSTLDPNANPEDVGLSDPGAAFATDVQVQCPSS